MSDSINFFDDYFYQIRTALAQVNRSSLEKAFSVIDFIDHIYLAGNGGSAAICNHWLTDFMKGVNEDTNSRVSATSLVSDTSLMTAIANDFSYDEVFSKQLEYRYANSSPNSLVVAVSSSGNSKNVISLVEKANELGIPSLSLTGFSGGVLRKISKYNFMSG